MSEPSVQILISPAVLSAKNCHAYVGGKPIFDELLAKHPDILKPFRRTTRGDTFYRTKTVDAAIAVAEAAGTLLKPKAEAHPA